MSQPTPARGAIEVLRYSGVTLEAITPSSVGSVSGLDLQVGPRTLAMSNASTGVSQSVPYEQVADVHCGERGTMSDGSLAVVMSAVVAGRPLRWLIPIGQLSLTQAMGLESVLRQRVSAAAAPWLSPPTALMAPPREPTPGSGQPPLREATPRHGQPPTRGALPAPSLVRPGSPPPPPAPVPAPRGPPAAPARFAAAPVAPAPPVPLPPAPGPSLPGPLPVGPGWDPAAGATPMGAAPPPVMPWWTTLPHDRARRRAARETPRRRGRLLTGLVAVEVMLVIAAIVLPIAANNSSVPHPPAGVAFSDRDLARQLNLQQTDLPSTWTVDHSSNGPLSGFLTPSGGTGAPTPQDQQLAAQVASQFEQCMGISASKDRIFGSAGSKPSAVFSSPAFASPASAPDEEAASSVDVYKSSALVAADVAQIAKTQFPSCFGAALGTSFVGAADASTSGDQVGQPTVQVVTLPKRTGIVAAGVDVTVPVTRQGATVPIQFGVVLVGGYRAESTLYTFSEPQPFPAALTTSLTDVLAKRIVAESSGTAA